MPRTDLASQQEAQLTADNQRARSGENPMARRSEPITKSPLADGRTRYRAICDFDSLTSGKRKQVRRTFDTVREARDWLAAARTEHRAGILVAPSSNACALARRPAHAG